MDRKLLRTARRAAGAVGLSPRGALVYAAWIVLVLAAWAAVVCRGGHLATVRENAGVGLAMVLGSYVAGSTPMGGGTVGFPAMVHLFDFPAAVGRDFSLAIQSVGMTSAALLILLGGRPVQRTLLRWGLLGSAVATPCASLLAAPHVPDGWVAMAFAILCAGFGGYQLLALRARPRAAGAARGGGDPRERWLGLGVGAAGGAVAALIGTGADILAYSAVVLILRGDVRRALYTSVVLMAATSVFGLASRAASGGIDPAAYHGWLAAAPVVVFGAAAGTVAAGWIPRRVTVALASALCCTQYAWTCLDLGLRGADLAGSALAVAGWAGALWALGRRVSAPRPHGRRAPRSRGIQRGTSRQYSAYDAPKRRRSEGSSRSTTKRWNASQTSAA